MYVRGRVGACERISIEGKFSGTGFDPYNFI